MYVVPHHSVLNFRFNLIMHHRITLNKIFNCIIHIPRCYSSPTSCVVYTPTHINNIQTRRLISFSVSLPKPPPSMHINYPSWDAPPPSTPDYPYTPASFPLHHALDVPPQPKRLSIPLPHFPYQQTNQLKIPYQLSWTILTWQTMTTLQKHPTR